MRSGGRSAWFRCAERAIFPAIVVPHRRSAGRSVLNFRDVELVPVADLFEQLGNLILHGLILRSQGDQRIADRPEIPYQPNHTGLDLCMPVQTCRTRPNRAEPNRTAGNLPCRTQPYTTIPCRSEPALPCHATPNPSEPAARCLTTPDLTAPVRTPPRLRYRSAPYSAQPDPTGPDLSVPA